MSDIYKHGIVIGLIFSLIFLVTLYPGAVTRGYGADNFFPANPGYEGFDMETPVTVYNKSNIFDHINGEAEVYFPLGFRFLYLQSHRKQDTGVVISVEAYDMGSDKGAKSIFEKYSQDGGTRLKGFSGQSRERVPRYTPSPP